MQNANVQWKYPQGLIGNYDLTVNGERVLRVYVRPGYVKATGQGWFAKKHLDGDMKGQLEGGPPKALLEAILEGLADTVKAK